MILDKGKKVLCSLCMRVFLCFLALITACVFSMGYTYYHNSYKLLEENTYSLLDSVLLQSKERIDGKLEQAAKILADLQYEPSFRRITLQNYKNGYSNYYQDVGVTGARLHGIRDSNMELIDSAYFYNKNGLELFTVNFSPLTRMIQGDDVWKLYKNQNTESVRWRMIHDDELFSGTSMREVLTVYQIVNSQKQNIQYFIGINLKTKAFLEILNRSDFEENGYVAIVGDDRVLYSDHCQEKYKVNGEIIGKIQKSGYESDWLHVENDHHERLLLKSVVLRNGWRLSAVMPETDLRNQIKGKLHHFITILAGVSVIGIFLSVLLSRSVTKPVKELAEKIDGLEYGNLDVVFDVNSSGEAGILAACLNNMISRIKKLLQEVKEKESQRRKYELAVIQAQINPHFLYNTLASLKNLVQYGESDRAVHMIDMLICFYRTGLGRGKMTVTLKEEMDHISSYLEVQSMRYGDKITYQVDMPEELKQACIMKLSVQPLVENALYHGLKEQGTAGVILVSARNEGYNLVICVFDDGKGMSPEHLEVIRKEINHDFQDSDSLVTYGLRNVHQRIQLKYGEGYGLEIQSVEGEYTQVTMTLPLQYY